MQQEKRIAIIEIDSHPEVLRNTLAIFSRLPVTCEIFVVRKIWEEAGVNADDYRFNVHIVEKKAQINAFFKTKINIINQCDVVFFYTLATHYKIFTRLPVAPPKVLLVHNANSYLKSFSNLFVKLSFFYIRKDIAYILLDVLFRLDLYYRAKLLKEKIDYFCFPSERITTYVKENNYIPKEKIVPEFPLVYTKFKHRPPPGKVTIAIIGNIEKRRRNYDIVYQAFANLSDKLESEVELLLLGRPIGYYGRSTIKRFKKLNRGHFKVTAFNAFIPQDTFEAYIEKTHFLIIPAYKRTHYKLFKELYGYTKISGNVNDMITYSKPAIIPSSYPLPANLESVAETYESKGDLIKLLQKWIHSKKYLEFDFKQLHEEYELSNISEKAANAINKIEIEFKSNS